MGGNGDQARPSVPVVDPEARATIQMLSASFRALLECLIARGALRPEDADLITKRRDQILACVAQGRDLPPPDFPQIVLPR